MSSKKTRLLFKTPDGCPMRFHLAQLTDYDLYKYSKLITLNGGEIEEQAKPDVLTFAPGVPHREYDFLFDIKFFDECIRFKKIVDVASYYIGDSRLFKGCAMSKLILQTKSCPLNQTLYQNNEDVIVTSFEEIDEDNENNEINEINENEDITSSDDESDSDYYKDDESDSCNYEPDERPRRSRNKLTKSKLEIFFSKFDDLEDWIQELNRNRVKDAQGYPRKMGRTYDSWETKNLIMLIVKTEAYQYMYSMVFWKHVATLKIVDQSRNPKSLYKHIFLRVLKNIENLKFINRKVKEKFIEARDQ